MNTNQAPSVTHAPVNPHSASSSRPTFELYEYNPRRRMRGVEAARVLVTYPDGEQDLLWMSPKDIRDNIAEFGTCAGLQAALQAYYGKPAGPIHPTIHECE